MFFTAEDIEREAWRLEDACYFLMGFNRGAQNNDRYYQRNGIITRHFTHTCHTYTANGVKIWHDLSSYHVIPELFIEWAYSEGYCLSENNVLIEFAQERLGRPLKRYNFGRYESFYPHWLKQYYWISTHALKLMYDDGLRTIQSASFNGDENFNPLAKQLPHHALLDDEMCRDLEQAAQTNNIPTVAGHIRHDLFEPSVVLDWAIRRGYTLPKDLMIAYRQLGSQLPQKNKLSEEQRRLELETLVKKIIEIEPSLKKEALPQSRSEFLDCVVKVYCQNFKLVSLDDFSRTPYTSICKIKRQRGNSSSYWKEFATKHKDALTALFE